jgi:nucleoside-diphosphate-sugar epimerase
MGNALVTGSAGFVGRNFVKFLHAAGWKVRGCDIQTGEDALDFFRNPYDPFTYDLVVHCAAVVGGRQVIDGKPLSQLANIELDAALFRWAARRDVGRVIYLSSSAAYPVVLQQAKDRQRLGEEHLLPWADVIGRPDQLYGWAKVNGEVLAHRARQAGMPVTVVRPFSGYGEDQEADYPFPAFIDRALRKENPFLVWGTGDQVRDFIHIDDIVAACMELYQGEVNGPVNLGWGLPVSMRQLAAAICERAGYEPRFEFSPGSPAGVEYRVARNAELRKWYRPSVSLEEGIDRALSYRSRIQ